MLSSIGNRRALHLCLIALVLGFGGCASGADAPTPVPAPQPLFNPGPEPVRPAVRPKRASARTPEVVRAPQPERRAKPAKPEVPARVRPPAPVRLDSTALERAATKRFAYQPLSVALARRTRKAELADRIAAAVVYEAERNRISPSLLAAVLLIENAPFDTTAISKQGAVGLMQVMPIHIGSYGCPYKDLHIVEANICHGARVLKNYLHRYKTVPLALKRYNGCVRGRNTPRCYRYPIRVMRVASKLRHEMLVSAQSLRDDTDELDADSTPSRAASVPSQPVAVSDSTQTTTQASECTTFVGCLKYRWTRR